MSISLPFLTPVEGYTEVERNGQRIMYPVDATEEKLIEAYENGFISKAVLKEDIGSYSYRTYLLKKLSESCQKSIYMGQPITLSDGSVEYFEFKDQDQSNIKQLWDAIKDGATAYPYQSDTGSCKIYPASDIAKIYVAMSTTVTSNLTYYHQLKDYMKSLESVDDAEIVTWGQELTGKYLEHYNAMMEEANAQMQSIIEKFGAAQ